MRRIISIFLLSLLILQNLVLGTFALNKYIFFVLDNHQIESNPLGQSNNSPFEFNHTTESNQIEIKLKADRHYNSNRKQTIAKTWKIAFLPFVEKSQPIKNSEKTTIYKPNKHILNRALLI